MKPEVFIGEILSAVKESAQETKIPVSFTIAEAALESAWGTSLLATEGRNLFGVKADRAWVGPIVVLNTREYWNDRWVDVPARWRKYESFSDCIKDHASFLLKNERYRACFKYSDGIGFASAVAAAGYATDPNYAEKIISILRQYDLCALDD